MSITAKELAKQLGLSATAVSMALNNKPGVSTKTRENVIKYAESKGYDFSKLSTKKYKNTSIYCIIYHAHNAILKYAPVFNEIVEGIEKECYDNGYILKSIHIYGNKDDIQRYIEDIRISNCAGVLLLGTEMDINICHSFLQLSMPIVIIDNHYDTIKCSSVLINNVQAAYIATNYLFDQTGKQPGHLSSSYHITNFNERRLGYERAIHEHGMSIKNCICHQLSPSIDGAFSDMLEIIDDKNELASCYFADNDLIAIGVIKALKTRGFNVPNDIAVIGVDNIPESKIIDPALSTMDIPRRFMGRTAVKQLLSEIAIPIPHKVKIEISTTLIKRNSV